MKNCLLIIYLILGASGYAQRIDSSREFIDFRRITPDKLPRIEKYAQPKEQVFPLGYGTAHPGEVNTGTGIWTELNPKVPRVTYVGLHFMNKDTGWACGGSGAIIKTTNGGTDWTTAETPVNNLLLKIDSYNGQVVICTGYDGIILRSTNGGDTFEQISSGTTYDLWCVKMINATLGWVCGMNWTLLKTTDAGFTWQSVNPGLNDHYWAVDFLNENYGMVACGGGKILKTTNGGFGWSIMQAGDDRALFTIDVIDSLHIAAAGTTGKNVYSSDGGSNWISNNDVVVFSSVNWIDFIDADTGYCVRDIYNIAKTTNRGQTWFPPNSIYVTSEWHIQLLKDGTGYSCGEEIGGTYALNICKRTNWLDNWARVILNVNWSDVYFIDEQKGFLISSDVINGGLYKTENGGLSYQKAENCPSGSDIFFLDSLIGFIGGDLIYKTSDGGNLWYSTIGISNNISKLFFINEQIGWAEGGHKIYKTIDGGETWDIKFTHPSSTFSGISFADSLFGWVSGGRPQKTTDGGLTWVEQTNTEIWNSDDVYIENRDTVWFSEYSDISPSLFKSTNNGFDWFPIPEVTGARKFYFFPDPIHWIILGFSRYYITTDDGNSWIEYTDEVPTGITSFYAPTNHKGFASGKYGLILKYVDTTYVPVEIISFSAEVNEENILLFWNTATETNNKGFEVEKQVHSLQSAIGKWETIGFVEGTGTTTITHSYSYSDNSVSPGKYSYRLKQIDFDGSNNYSKEVEIDVNAPMEFALAQNYPNPFNPTTNISFTIQEETNVNLKLYDITGGEIRVLVNEKKRPGYYTIKLKGGELSSGVYFYRLVTSSGYAAVKKLILLK
jgi:photosystem II stability/assembly factor-like uncharacterized protein